MYMCLGIENIWKFVIANNTWNVVYFFVIWKLSLINNLLHKFCMHKLVAWLTPVHPGVQKETKVSKQTKRKCWKCRKK